jgi:hypothetical protein
MDNGWWILRKVLSVEFVVGQDDAVGGEEHLRTYTDGVCAEAL